MTGEWVILVLCGAVAACAVTAGVVWGVTRRRWARRVRALSATAEALARGDWAARAEGAGDEEAVRELATGLNAIGARARQQLEEREEQRRVMQALVDTLPDPVMLVEAHRRITLINPAAGRLLGVAPATAVNRWLGEVVRDRSLLETIEALPPVVGESGETSAPVEREVQLERDGHRLTYQAVATRTADGVLLVLRDVTALAETLRMKSDFVANASHELRTPVAAIKAAFETLSEAYTDDPRQADRCVQIIDGHLRRLEELLRDLLDLSRLESPELRVEPGEVRPSEVFAGIRAAFGEMAAAKAVEIRAVADSDAAVMADGRLLNMVLKNLVENAVKYTPTGGSVTLRVRDRAAEGSFVVEVSDTGIGIPAEHVHRVFERFYQVDPARSGSAGRGTGLGLAIVKHAVTAMGGTVTLASRPGLGTTVTCVFPQPARERV